MKACEDDIVEMNTTRPGWWHCWSPEWNVRGAGDCHQPGSRLKKFIK